MKNVKRLAAIPLIVLTFILFSAMGLLPKSISVKIPASLQSYPAFLPVTGFSVSDRQENEPDNKTFAKGSFDRLGLFENANIRNNGYYSRTSKRIVWSKKDELVKIKEKKADAGKRAWLLLGNDEINCQPVIHKGRYYFFIDQGKVIVNYDKKHSYTITARCDGEQELLSLLEKQTKERITLRQLCALLNETANGHLLHFDPKTHTALLFRESADGKGAVVQCNTETGKQSVLLNFVGLTSVYACSATEIVFYNDTIRKLEYYDFESKSGLHIANEIDCPEAVNFVRGDDSKLYIFHTDGQDIVRTDVKEKKYFTCECNNAYCYLVCGKNGLIASDRQYYTYLSLSLFNV